MANKTFIKLLIAGDLTRDYLIDRSGRAHNNIPGGSLFFAAAGARIWNDHIGLIGRIGSDYPDEWVGEAEKRGFNTLGIMRLAQTIDHRRFYAWRDAENFDNESPVAYYARYGLTFPHDLLGYHPNKKTENLIWSNITTTASKDFPKEYMDVTGVHICPMDFLTHVKLPSYLSKGSVNTFTLSPSDDYMKPEYCERIPAITKGISAFIPTELQISSLFRGRTTDLWEMAESLTDGGCSFVIILRGEKGYWLYDASAKKKYVVPVYPTKWIDPTGADDVFAGAFLGEYKNSYDPLQAVIHGSVAASFAVEGSGAFYCMDRLPGLEIARAESIHPLIKTV